MPNLSKQLNLSNKTTIYPNPTNDLLHISCPVTYFDFIEIADLAGEIHFLKKNVQEKTIPVASLTSGIYIIRIGINNEIINQKVIKE